MQEFLGSDNKMTTSGLPATIATEKASFRNLTALISYFQVKPLLNVAQQDEEMQLKDSEKHHVKDSGAHRTQREADSQKKDDLPMQLAGCYQ